MTEYKGIAVELHEKTSCGCGGCIFDSAEEFIDTHGLDLDINSLWEDDSEREAIQVAFEMDDDEIEQLRAQFEEEDSLNEKIAQLIRFDSN